MSLLLQANSCKIITVKLSLPNFIQPTYNCIKWSFLLKVKVLILILTIFLPKTLIYSFFPQTDSGDVENTLKSNPTSPATQQMRLDKEQRDKTESLSFATDDMNLIKQS